VGCRDRSIDYLKAYGYNVVRLPKADLRPLELLSRGDGALDRFGQLTTVLVGDGSAPLPPTSDDIEATHISGQRSSELKIGLGLSILGNIIAAMGGSELGLSVSYQHAAAVSFEFSNVRENRVEVAALDRYLASADIDPLSRQAARFLEDEAMYIVTSTIKSEKLTVRAQTSDGGSLDLDVPVIQEAVGGNISVSASDKKASVLTYEGPVPLVFGFQAVQLFYEDGVYRAIASAEGVTARALTDAPKDGAVRYVAAAPMLRLND
jgi:hypothetical protein